MILTADQCSYSITLNPWFWYSGLQHQSIGLKFLYTSIGIDRITTLVEHTWMSATSYKLLRNTMEELKLEVGSLGWLLELQFNTYGALATKFWMKHRWQISNKYEINIYDDLPDFGLLREKDKLLITTIIRNMKGGLYVIKR